MGDILNVTQAVVPVEMEGVLDAVGLLDKVELRRGLRDKIEMPEALTNKLYEAWYDSSGAADTVTTEDGSVLVRVID